MAGDTYLVVLDKELGYCRLFREDSDCIPAGETLWCGEGPRHGYDAMIRLNNERRPIRTHSVVSSVNASGRAVYRIVSGGVEEGAAVHSVHYNDFPGARRELKSLVEKRNAAETAAKEETLAIMRRVGIASRRIPKFTDKDLRYLGWLRETGKLAA